MRARRRRAAQPQKFSEASAKGLAALPLIVLGGAETPFPACGACKPPLLGEFLRGMRRLFFPVTRKTRFAVGG